MIYDPLRLGLQQFAPMMPDEEDPLTAELARRAAITRPGLPPMPATPALAPELMARMAGAAQLPVTPPPPSPWELGRLGNVPNIPIPPMPGGNFAVGGLPVPPRAAAPMAAPSAMPAPPPMAPPPASSVPFPALLNQAPMEASPLPAPLDDERARYARAGVQFNPASGPMFVRELRGSTPGMSMLGGTPEERSAAFTSAAVPDRMAMMNTLMSGQLATEPQITAQGRGYTQYASPQHLNAPMLEAALKTAISPEALAAQRDIAEIQATGHRGGMTSEERALQQKRITTERQTHNPNPALAAKAFDKLDELDEEFTALQTGQTKAQVRQQNLQETTKPTVSALTSYAAKISKDLGEKGTSTEGFLRALSDLPNIPDNVLAKVVGEHAAILTPGEIDKAKQNIAQPPGLLQKFGAGLSPSYLSKGGAPAAINELIAKKRQESFLVNQLIDRISQIRGE